MSDEAMVREAGVSSSGTAHSRLSASAAAIAVRSPTPNLAASSPPAPSLGLGSFLIKSTKGETTVPRLALASPM